MDATAKLLEPMIYQRIKDDELRGIDRAGRPVSSSIHSELRLTFNQDDLISWLLDEAKGDDKTPRGIAIRVMIANFGATHTIAVVCNL